MSIVMLSQMMEEWDRLVVVDDIEMLLGSQVVCITSEFGLPSAFSFCSIMSSVCFFRN